jgi:hypothetical protein
VREQENGVGQKPGTVRGGIGEIIGFLQTFAMEPEDVSVGFVSVHSSEKIPDPINSIG